MNRQKWKCIALDLDGTLLGAKGELTQRSREALEAAIEKGIHVVVASGRSYASLPKAVMEIPGIEYAITSNGAAVYRVRDSKCIKSCKLRPEAALQVVRTAEKILGGKESALPDKLTQVYELFIDGKAFATACYVQDPVRYGADEAAISYVQNTRTPVLEFESFFLEHLAGLDSLDIVTADLQKKAVLMEEIEKTVPHIYLTSSIPRLIEISDEHSGKETALAWLCGKLGIGMEETAAFGNADNDAQMLSCAGCGIAVQNATPACLEAADRICASNEADGAADAVLALLKEVL